MLSEQTPFDFTRFITLVPLQPTEAISHFCDTALDDGRYKCNNAGVEQKCHKRRYTYIVQQQGASRCPTGSMTWRSANRALFRSVFKESCLWPASATSCGDH